MMLEDGARPDTFAGVQLLHPLILAAQEGHTDVVEVFLEWGINPNSDVDYWWAEWAAKDLAWLALMATAHEPVLRVLHAHGADMKHPLLLCRASGHGTLPAVKFLIEMGGNLGAADAENYFTPLGSAVNTGNLGIIRFLLDMGADPNQAYGEHLTWTPISSAAARGDHEIVRFLLQNGAKLRTTNSDRFYFLSPLSLAADNDHRAVAELLLGNIDLDSSDENQAVLLAAAATFGIKSMVEQVLSKGCNADARCSYSHATPIKKQRTALSRAARNGHADIVELLLQFGADPSGGNDIEIEMDQRPLFSAVEGGHEKIVQRLLGTGGDWVTAQLRSPELSLLQIAIPHPRVFELLLRHGADPYGTAGKAPMPILEVLKSRSVTVLQILLDKGFSLLDSSLNAKGADILGAAAQGGGEMLRFLSSRWLYPDYLKDGEETAVLRKNIFRGNASTVDFFLKGRGFGSNHALLSKVFLRAGRGFLKPITVRRKPWLRSNCC